MRRPLFDMPQTGEEPWQQRVPAVQIPLGSETAQEQKGQCGGVQRAGRCGFADRGCCTAAGKERTGTVFQQAVQLRQSMGARRGGQSARRLGACPRKTAASKAGRTRKAVCVCIRHHFGSYCAVCRRGAFILAGLPGVCEGKTVHMKTAAAAVSEKGTYESGYAAALEENGSYEGGL